ncbi:MAG: hypothetical protein SFV54_25870 [Bryobacteraceae bacterium]|nr:hypothetical protein [Bryobacteraceae bacterium]
MLKSVVIALLAGSAALAALLAIAQSPFAPSRFEFGLFREYEGDLFEWPHPLLIGDDGRRYLLVVAGKHGAAERVRGFDGKRVRLRGSLIERGSDRMLEIDSVEATGPAARRRQQPLEVAKVRLTGEIVDSKCFLGVMNPGQGKVHRDCAVRCISGGIPAALFALDERGKGRLLLLTGIPKDELLPMIGERVTIAGALLRDGPQWILRRE